MTKNRVDGMFIGKRRRVISAGGFKPNELPIISSHNLYAEQNSILKSNLCTEIFEDHLDILDFVLGANHGVSGKEYSTNLRILKGRADNQEWTEPFDRSPVTDLPEILPSSANKARPIYEDGVDFPERKSRLGVSYAAERDTRKAC